MTECLADPTTSLPNAKHNTTYEIWSRGGSAVLITGNVMVDRRYKGVSCVLRFFEK